MDELYSFVFVTHTTVKAPLTDSSLGTVLIRIGLLRNASLLNGHGQQFFPSLKIKLPWTDAAPVNGHQAELVASFYMHQHFFNLLLLVYDLLS
jgi:hypothetical protein